MTRKHLRLNRPVPYPRAMTTPIFTVTGSNPARPLGTLPTNVQNMSGVVAALLADRKMQAAGLQEINVIAGEQSVSIGQLETLVNESISEFITKSTNEELLKECELTKGTATDPRTASYLSNFNAVMLCEA